MSDNIRKRGLGRGLSSLLDGVSTSQTDGAALRRVPIELLRPNPDQPRKVFPATELDELAESIRRNGVLQPLLVRPAPDGSERFQIVAGERRWRAAQAAGLHEVPVIERDLGDDETLQIAIVENIQRADLNPIEESKAYQNLIESFGHSQAEVARVVGKSRPHVANMLRLLTLPDEVKALVLDQRLSAGHARALIGAHDPAALARKIIAEGLTVRQAEDLARRVPGARTQEPRSGRSRKDADTAALEADLAAALSLRVVISHKGESGELRIAYANLEELDGLCQLLMR